MYTTSLINTPTQSPYTNYSSNCMNYINYCSFSNQNEFLNYKENYAVLKRKIPIKIILNDDEEVASIENNSETTEENSTSHLTNISGKLKNYAQGKFVNFNFSHKNLSLKNNKINSSPHKVVYIFNILKSRKKEKKYLRKKFNKIISRVHNMDCLLKKIKA